MNHFYDKSSVNSLEKYLDNSLGYSVGIHREDMETYQGSLGDLCADIRTHIFRDIFPSCVFFDVFPFSSFLLIPQRHPLANYLKKSCRDFLREREGERERERERERDP